MLVHNLESIIDSFLMGDSKSENYTVVCVGAAF